MKTIKKLSIALTLLISSILLFSCTQNIDLEDIETESVIESYKNPDTDDYDFTGTWQAAGNSSMTMTISDDYFYINANRTDVPELYIYTDESSVADATKISNYDSGAIVIDESDTSLYSAPDVSVYYHDSTKDETDAEGVFVTDIKFVDSYERYVFHLSFNQNENDTSDDTITITLEINDSDTQSSPNEKTYTLNRDDD